MSANLFLEYLFWAIWIVIGVITLIGLFAAIQAFRGKISWGTARYMGITAFLFSWMNVIYGLVLVEAAYGVVSFFLDLPLWIDISLILIILVLLMIVYRELKKGKKFKPAMFMSLFLIPLGIHGIHTVGKMMLRVDAPVKKLASMFRETPAKKPTAKVKRFPRRIRVGDSGFEIEFRNSQKEGRFGDWLTATRLTAQHYGKEPSKFNEIHGIDGVYVKYYDNGNPQEILIVENKVGSGKLGQGQMTDEGIAKRVKKMIDHPDPEVRRTGELIRENPGLVRKELWHHHLASGKTTVSRLDAEARETSVKTYNYIGSATRKRCESSKPSIVCIPATQ